MSLPWIYYLLISFRFPQNLALWKREKKNLSTEQLFWEGSPRPFVMWWTRIPRVWFSMTKPSGITFDLHQWKKGNISKMAPALRELQFLYPIIILGKNKRYASAFPFNELFVSFKVLRGGGGITIGHTAQFCCKKKIHLKQDSCHSADKKTHSGSSVVEWINKMTPNYTNV